MMPMKKYFLILSCFYAGFLNAQEWKLVWSDEFSGTSLDTSVWNIEVNGHGGGNNELQYYTARPENLYLKDGLLVLEARKESYKGKNFTSARINTKGKAFWKYGKVEARIRLPYGKGIWPAFWMLGENIDSTHWPACGETDIMELIGGPEGDKTVYSTLHWRGSQDHESKGDPYVLQNGRFTDDFHLFSCIWSEKVIQFFCDSQPITSIDITSAEMDEFRAHFFIILNLAVGGNWPGNPDESTVFPQKMLVDYVRVYQLNK